MEFWSPNKNTDKRIVYLICEGVFDLMFLEVYLKRKGKYELLADSDSFYHFGNGVKHSCLYHKGKNIEINLFSVGGQDKINAFYDSHLRRQMDVVGSTSGLIVIVDADSNPETAAKKISFEGIKLENRQWMKGKLASLEWSSGYSYYISYLCVVPFREQGALETVLLNALSSKEEAIVRAAKKFVDSLPSEGNETKHIRKPRLKLKAKLGVSLDLIDPIRIPERLEALLSSISLNDKSIEDHFGFLLHLEEQFV